jgi:hypothetical protein
MRQSLSIIYTGALALLLLLGGCVSTQNNFVEGKQQFLLGNYHQAFSKLQPLAIQGNTQAQYAVGYMYFYGLGTIKNEEAARKWMLVAAEQGHPEARAALAKLAPLPSASTLPGERSAIFENDSQLQGNSDKPEPVFPVKPDVKSTVKKETGYTLQLMGAFTIDALNDFAVKHNLQPTIKRSDQLHQGRVWYVLTYGEYRSQTAAEIARQKLPEAIQQLKPWVRETG